MHPASVKNTFMSHIVFWLVFLPILTIIFLPLLKMKADIDPSELKMVAGAGVNVGEVADKVNARFSDWFIRSGIMPATESFFGGYVPGRQQQEGMGMATNMRMFAADWVRGMWIVIYRAMWRLQALSGIYVAALFAICLPALIDGLAIRARKRYQFENYNPVFFYFSYHSAVLVLGMLFYLPIVPVALSPLIVIMFLGLLGTAIWWAAANLQTGS